jgi:hypothetical protein
MAMVGIFVLSEKLIVSRRKHGLLKKNKGMGIK